MIRIFRVISAVFYGACFIVPWRYVNEWSSYRLLFYVFAIITLFMMSVFRIQSIAKSRALTSVLVVISCLPTFDLLGRVFIDDGEILSRDLIVYLMLCILLSIQLLLPFCLVLERRLFLASSKKLH